MKFLGKKGQTSVEYMMMVFVAFTIGVALKNSLSNYFIKNPNSYLNKQLSFLEKSFQQDTAGRYSWYSMTMAR